MQTMYIGWKGAVPIPNYSRRSQRLTSCTKWMIGGYVRREQFIDPDCSTFLTFLVQIVKLLHLIHSPRERALPFKLLLHSIVRAMVATGTTRGKGTLPEIRSSPTMETNNFPRCVATPRMLSTFTCQAKVTGVGMTFLRGTRYML